MTDEPDRTPGPYGYADGTGYLSAGPLNTFQEWLYNKLGPMGAILYNPGRSAGTFAEGVAQGASEVAAGVTSGVRAGATLATLAGLGYLFLRRR